MSKRKHEEPLISVDEEYVWKIDDFQKKIELLNDSRKGGEDTLHSFPFLMGIDVKKPSEWELEFGLTRDGGSNEKHVSLSLKLLNNYSKKPESSVLQTIYNLVRGDAPVIKVAPKFTIISSIKKHLTRGPPAMYSEYFISDKIKDNASFGYMKFMPLKDLWNWKNEFWSNDVLEIRLNSKIFGDEVVKNFKKVPRVFKELVVDVPIDLLHLLESGVESDFTIKLGEDQFPVHKAILITRAPFFAELFTPGVAADFGKAVGKRNDKTFEVTGRDLTPVTMKRVLEFIYSGQVVCEEMDMAFFKDMVLGAEAFGLEKLKHSLMNFKLKQDSLKLHDFPDIFNFIIQHGPNGEINDKLLAYAATNRKYLTLLPGFKDGLNGGMISLFSGPDNALFNEGVSQLAFPEFQSGASNQLVAPNAQLEGLAANIEPEEIPVEIHQAIEPDGNSEKQENHFSNLT